MDAIVKQSGGAAPAIVVADAPPHDPLKVRQAAMLTAGLGLAHAVLLLLAVWLLKQQTPGVNATDEELIAFYSDPEERRVVFTAGLYLIPFAGIAFIWFIVALRMWETASAVRENVLLSNVQLVSGIIYTTLLFAAGASMSVLAASVELSGASIDPLVAREFPQYGSTLLLVFAMRMAAMFVLTTSNLGRTSGILPRWFVYVGFAMTLGLLLTASLNSWLVVAFPAWILVFCAILVDRARRIPRGLVISEPGEVVARSATRGGIHR